MKYHSAFKKENISISSINKEDSSVCDKMDKLWRPYTKWNKPVDYKNTKNAWFYWCKESEIVPVIDSKNGWWSPEAEFLLINECKSSVKQDE